MRIEAEHVAIEVDPALTEQMVDTLLSNAGRRTAPGNPVWVKVSSDQGGVVIAVDDTGPEVPPGLRGAMVAAIGDKGPAARQRPRGATGLSLLSRLAEIHGGRAWVEERPGGGASFRVFLPDAGEPHEELVDERAAARTDPYEDPYEEAAESFVVPIRLEPVAEDRLARAAAEGQRAALRKESIEKRATARVRDVEDERAIALARALIAADDEEDDVEEEDLFEKAAVSSSLPAPPEPTTNGTKRPKLRLATNGHARPSVKDLPGSLRL
jgi:hypothetical protein